MTPWNIGQLTLREWSDIQIDVWEMQKDADPRKRKAGGAKEMAAFAQAVNTQDGK